MKTIAFYYGDEIVSQTILKDGEDADDARYRISNDSHILCNRPLENPIEFERKLYRSVYKIYNSGE
jgi:hypothetical protein